MALLQHSAAAIAHLVAAVAFFLASCGLFAHKVGLDMIIGIDVGLFAALSVVTVGIAALLLFRLAVLFAGSRYGILSMNHIVSRSLDHTRHGLTAGRTRCGLYAVCGAGSRCCNRPSVRGHSMLMRRSAAAFSHDGLIIDLHVGAVAALSMGAVADGVSFIIVIAGAADGTGAIFNNVIPVRILCRLAVLVLYQLADDRIDDLHKAGFCNGTAGVADAGTAVITTIRFSTALCNLDGSVFDGHSADAAYFTVASADAGTAICGAGLFHNGTVADLYIAIAASAV